MLDLIVFLTLCIFFPWLIVGAVLGSLVGSVAIAIHRTFYLPLLVMSLSAAGLSIQLFANSKPNPDLPWISLVESIAQSHIAGLSTPAAVAILAVLLFFASLTRRLKQPAI